MTIQDFIQNQKKKHGDKIDMFPINDNLYAVVTIKEVPNTPSHIAEQIIGLIERTKEYSLTSNGLMLGLQVVVSFGESINVESLFNSSFKENETAFRINSNTVAVIIGKATEYTKDNTLWEIANSVTETNIESAIIQGHIWQILFLWEKETTLITNATIDARFPLNSEDPREQVGSQDETNYFDGASLELIKLRTENIELANKLAEKEWNISQIQSEFSSKHVKLEKTWQSLEEVRKNKAAILLEVNDTMRKVALQSENFDKINHFMDFMEKIKYILK